MFLHSNQIPWRIQHPPKGPQCQILQAARQTAKCWRPHPLGLGSGALGRERRAARSKAIQRGPGSWHSRRTAKCWRKSPSILCAEIPANINIQVPQTSISRSYCVPLHKLFLALLTNSLAPNAPKTPKLTYLTIPSHPHRAISQPRQHPKTRPTGPTTRSRQHR